MHDLLLITYLAQNFNINASPLCLRSFEQCSDLKRFYDSGKVMECSMLNLFLLQTLSVRESQ